jgi:probable HAF family extracellular repeat protein
MPREGKMKSRIVSCVSAMTLFPLAMPVRLDAQERQERKQRTHRYEFIDLDTFGGPTSYINSAASQGASNQINRRGATVGASATAIPSPPNTNVSICEGFLGAVPFVFHAFKWQDGVVTDLGTLPGPDNCSVATSMNARGEIIGYSENGATDPLTGIREIRAVLWKDGEIKDLGTFGGNHSLVGRINNRGQIAGDSLNATPDSFSLYDRVILNSPNGTQTHAFLWQNGRKRDLQTLGGPDAQGFLLNEAGQVAGPSYTNSTPNPTTGLPTLNPFLWDDGRMIDLGTLGGAYGLPTALNNRGQVIGYSSLAADPGACFSPGPGSPHCDPFLWSEGKLIDLSTETIGGNPITANAINDAGEIVGLACFPTGTCGAYLWRNGTAIDLGALPRDCYAEGIAINSRGQVVGDSHSCDGSTHSFLWHNGSMIDLTTFAPSGSGLQMVNVAAINDRGKIAGDEVPPSCGGGPTPTQGEAGFCGHAYVLLPCEDDEMDSSGCRSDDDADRNATSQSNAKSVPRAQTTAPQANLTPSEIKDRARAFLANRNRGFRGFPKN